MMFLVVEGLNMPPCPKLLVLFLGGFEEEAIK